MLKPKQKEKLIKESQIHEEDTGSADVQIVLLSESIKKLQSHLKKSPKDMIAKRSLLKMVVKRKRLLKYLEKENPRRHKKILEKIGLKK